MPQLRRFLVLSFLCAAVTFAYAGDLSQQLQDKYGTKTLVLRGFYPGERLRYDASGSLVGGNRSGDWTSDGFVRITAIDVKSHEIRIKAMRMAAVSFNKTWSLRVAENEVVRPGEKKEIAVEIVADLGTRHPSAGQVNAALAKIFLSENDDFAAVVPEYWRPCVPFGLAGKDQNCRFASEMLDIPGVRVPEHDVSGIASEATEQKSAPERGRFLVAQGISPPRVTLNKEPEFSDLARRMKYQGTAVLGLTVDQNGIPTNVYVLNPLGCGLDTQAVRAVEGWRFKPAEKDGHPVSVEIAVEVDFHLY